MALAVVSDHGFERVNTMVNLKAIAVKQGVTGVMPYGGIAIARDETAVEFLRKQSKDPQYGIGREIQKEELARFPSAFPAKAVAVFEAADGFMFWDTPNGEIFSKPREIGNHGHWPMRYRAVYVLWGPGIPHEVLPEFSMKEIAGRLAKVIGVPFTPGLAAPLR